MVQIFVKVDGMKTVVMEVSPEDKVQKILNTVSKSDRDVYVTSGGRTLKGGDKLKSCEVRDGSTVEITSRMRGGGRHKDKKSKVEKKEGMKQEPLKNEGPAILESEKEAVIRMLEETEEYRKTIESICDGSDVEVEQALQNYRTAGREVLGWNQGQADMMECGLRWAVEARREGRRQQEEEQRRQRKQGQHPGQEESKQGKQVRFGEEQQLGKTGAENAGEPEVMGRTTEVRTGRGSAGLARGGDERYRADETSRKGKGKGNGGKGEHEGKGGGFGHSGKQQETREKEEERVRMAPNMGAGGSHPQAMSDPEEGEIAEEKGTRGMRWADCEDDEGEKNKEEQETEEAESKKEQEEGARKKEMTDERPPGLEEVESEPKTQGEEQSQVESKQEAQEEEESGRGREQNRAQEAREEERRAQEAHEEERRAQEAREEQKRAQEAREEQKRAQEAREEQKRAQEAREEESRAQEAREKETRAQEEQAREERKAQEEREEEREVEAQEGHEEAKEVTTQEKCVEAKKENSMHEENDVSNRHMTWWRNAWWIRMDSGPHMRTARGRRRVWRAARRAAEQARDNDGVGETQRFAEEAEGETEGRRKWEQGATGRKESNTLHVVFHLANATTPTTAAATATAAMRLQ